MGEGDGFEGPRHINVNMVQNVVSSGGTGDILKESGKYSSQICSVKVPHNNKGSIWVCFNCVLIAA